MKFTTTVLLILIAVIPNIALANILDYNAQPSLMIYDDGGATVFTHSSGMNNPAAIGLINGSSFIVNFPTGDLPFSVINNLNCGKQFSLGVDGYYSPKTRERLVSLIFSHFISDTRLLGFSVKNYSNKDFTKNLIFDFGMLQNVTDNFILGMTLKNVNYEKAYFDIGTKYYLDDVLFIKKTIWLSLDYSMYFGDNTRNYTVAAGFSPFNNFDISAAFNKYSHMHEASGGIGVNLEYSFLNNLGLSYSYNRGHYFGASYYHNFGNRLYTWFKPSSASILLPQEKELTTKEKIDEVTRAIKEEQGVAPALVTSEPVQGERQYNERLDELKGVLGEEELNNLMPKSQINELESLSQQAEVVASPETEADQVWSSFTANLSELLANNDYLGIVKQTPVYTQIKLLKYDIDWQRTVVPDSLITSLNNIASILTQFESYLVMIKIQDVSGNAYSNIKAYLISKGVASKRILPLEYESNREGSCHIYIINDKKVGELGGISNE